MVLKTLSSSFRVSDHHRSRRCYATASSLRAFVSTRGPQLDGADEPFGPERRVLGLDAGLDGRDRGVEEVEVGLDGLQVLLAVRSRCYCEGKDLCNSRVQCLAGNPLEVSVGKTAAKESLAEMQQKRCKHSIATRR
eukprot:3939498-Rhodomonas_salina.2